MKLLDRNRRRNVASPAEWCGSVPSSIRGGCQAFLMCACMGTTYPACGTQGVLLRATALRCSRILRITATTETFPRLAALTQPVVKPAHLAVVADHRPSAHVESAPHQSAAAPDGPMTSLLAAVSGPGRQPDQRCQSLAVPVARLGKIPTTSVRRRISLFRRSRGLLDQSFCQWDTGRVVKARMSGMASSSIWDA